jgi:hypothetical protein
VPLEALLLGAVSYLLHSFFENQRAFLNFGDL